MWKHDIKQYKTPPCRRCGASLHPSGLSHHLKRTRGGAMTRYTLRVCQFNVTWVRHTDMIGLHGCDILKPERARAWGAHCLSEERGTFTARYKSHFEHEPAAATKVTSTCMSLISLFLSWDTRHVYFKGYIGYVLGEVTKNGSAVASENDQLSCLCFVVFFFFLISYHKLYFTFNSNESPR